MSAAATRTIHRLYEDCVRGAKVAPTKAKAAHAAIKAYHAMPPKPRCTVGPTAEARTIVAANTVKLIEVVVGPCFCVI